MADEEGRDEIADDGGQAVAASKPAEKSPFVTLLLILNVLFMGGIAFLQYQAMQREANKPSLRQLVKEEMEAEANKSDELVDVDRPNGIVMPLEGFTVNLAQGDGPRRFVRLNAVLKFSEASKEAEFTARKPQIRDTIIGILNSKRPEDLLKREGKEFLKEEIKAAINSFLIDGEVIDIFYVGFQIN